MSSAFAFFLRPVCTTEGYTSFTARVDEFICLCFLETGNYLSVRALLRHFSLHLAFQGSCPACWPVHSHPVHSAHPLKPLCGLWDSLQPCPAPSVTLDSSSPSFLISLVRRLSISTVFPKNQLSSGSQLSFLSCRSLVPNSTRVCVTHAEQAGDAHTTPLEHAEHVAHTTPLEHGRRARQDGDPGGERPRRAPPSMLQFWSF